jgi:hypothetical protein
VIAEAARAALTRAGYSPRVITTDVHGWDFFRMINSDQAAFSIGLKVPNCALTVELNKFGEDHNVLELDDITTHHGPGWTPTSPHPTSSWYANSAHAGYGTKPKPPTIGGTSTASPPPPGSE